MTTGTTGVRDRPTGPADDSHGPSPTASREVTRVVLACAVAYAAILLSAAWLWSETGWPWPGLLLLALVVLALGAGDAAKIIGRLRDNAKNRAREQEIDWRLRSEACGLVDRLLSALSRSADRSDGKARISALEVEDLITDLERLLGESLGHPDSFGRNCLRRALDILRSLRIDLLGRAGQKGPHGSQVLDESERARLLQAAELIQGCPREKCLGFETP